MSPLKRKRGRPKGSKKKKTEQKESKADSAQSRKDNGQSYEDKNKEEDGKQCSVIKAGILKTIIVTCCLQMLFSVTE